MAFERKAAAAFVLAMSAALTPNSGARAEPPANPLVVEDMAAPGQRGGELRTLVGGAGDTKLLVVYGYARLVGYNRDLELVPDILENVEVEEGRVFTFHLREGHKWSDGAPFTTEDFRFFWEDVANNPLLRPSGPPVHMIVDGETPEVEIVDPTTIRYSWSKPNPFFLPAVAAAAPMFVYMPAHYLKGFHIDYADAAALEAQVEEAQARDWAQLFGRKSRQYKIVNEELPSLQPWALSTPSSAEILRAQRNDYFHRVDVNGVQLPYIDMLILEPVDGKLVTLKTGAGETDLQARGLFFKDYTFLRQAEERSGLATYLWRSGRGAHLALFPNLNVNDPTLRALFRDRRFRQALSVAVNRDAINHILYFGLGRPVNNTVLDGSPLYDEDRALAYTQFDPDLANALLDEIGLTERDSDDLRVMPNGQPLRFIVETAGEDSEQLDVLQLISDDWAEIGVKIDVRPSQRDLLRNRLFSGEAAMTIWYGVENGLPTADLSPQEFVPTQQVQAQWPMWGQYYETKGAAGEAPDLPEAQRLIELFDAWRVAAEPAERQAIWGDILDLASEEVFTIGLIGYIQQPIAADPNLMNVPQEAIYNWEPGAHFGIYDPSTFWWAN